MNHMSILPDPVKAEIAAYLGYSIGSLLCASSTEQRLEHENAVWDLAEQELRVKYSLLFEAKQLREGRLGAIKVASKIQTWHKYTHSDCLSPQLSTALALPALNNLHDEFRVLFGSLIANNLQAHNLYGETRRIMRFKPYPECLDDMDDWGADEGEVITAKHKLRGYGKASHEMNSEMCIGGVQFRLQANCRTEVDRGSYCQWEDGSVETRFKEVTSIPKHLLCQWTTILQWRGAFADAGDDEHVQISFVEDTIGKALVDRLNVEIKGTELKRFYKFIFNLLIQPFQLSGPPHCYAFEMSDWKQHLETRVMQQIGELAATE